ncbi:MAG: thiamine-phosphate pyrophosphorylase [Parvicellaceae bacterium]
MTETLQYITQDHPIWSHSELAEKACSHGVKWVQLRMKNVTQKKLLLEGLAIRKICSSYGATFILNDEVDLVKEVKADGVHVGLNDMSVADARAILGHEKIIGATANTFEDVITHQKAGVDYVGLGPFRHTSTKKVLSPIIGLEGYKEILSQLRLNGNEVPIVAIGGIEIEDFGDIFNLGIDGIAVSGLITRAFEKIEDALTFTKEVQL